MPIETSSDAWQSGTEPPTAEEIVTDFLRNNPDKAFTLRELANKIDMADWDSALERFEDKEKMGSEDFYDRYPADEDHPTVISESGITNDLYLKIRHLSQMGIIDVREVDATEIETPFEVYSNPEDPGTVLAIAYTADS